MYPMLTQTDIITYFEMSFIIFNQYIDLSNIDDPFKIEIDNRYQIMLNPEWITDTKIFIKENTYSIDNSYMYINKLNGKFYTIETINTQHTKYLNDGLFGVFKFQQDSKTTNYNIRVYSILDLFSSIGGIYEIITVLLSIVFSYFAQKMYLFYILNQVSKDEIHLNQQFAERQMSYPKT